MLLENQYLKAFENIGDQKKDLWQTKKAFWFKYTEKCGCCLFNSLLHINSSVAGLNNSDEFPSFILKVILFFKLLT